MAKEAKLLQSARVAQGAGLTRRGVELGLLQPHDG